MGLQNGDPTLHPLDTKNRRSVSPQVRVFIIVTMGDEVDKEAEGVR